MDFWKDGAKKLQIVYDGGIITNRELVVQGFTLHESICKGKQLVFGSCEAAEVVFKTLNVNTSLMGKKISGRFVDGNEYFSIGKYTVKSDKPNADRTQREVIAYDAMYDILNANVSEWYRNLDFPMTLREFRNSFAAHFGIEQEAITLCNDTMDVDLTIDDDEMSGARVIKAICEINGAFGHINRQGKLQYIILPAITEALYPRNDRYPADDLYPADESGLLIPSNKRYSASCEEYETQEIKSLQIKSEEEDVGVVIGNGPGYVISDNFLVFGKDANELTEIARRLFNVIRGVQYRPAAIKCVGNLNIGVGDAVVTRGKNAIIRTYVLNRTLTGVGALQDTLEAKGTETLEKNLNGVTGQLMRLAGKTNKLTKSVEQTQSTLTDTARGLQTQITQNASDISSVASTANGASSWISQNAYSISQGVANGNSAKSWINQNGTSILAGVESAENSAAWISINGNKIENAVVFGTSYTGFEITRSKFHIKSAGTFQVDSGNFTIDASGNVAMTGEVNATSGKLGGFTITDYGMSYVWNGTESLYLGHSEIEVAGGSGHSESSTIKGTTITSFGLSTDAFYLSKKQATWKQLSFQDADGREISGWFLGNGITIT